MPQDEVSAATSLERSEPTYWLAVVTEENYKTLAQMRYPFYAVNTWPDVQSGDLCILYRSGKRSGFVGIFEFTSGAKRELVTIRRFYNYKTKLPWRPIAIADQNPVSIAQMARILEFIRNKQNIGMALRTSLRKIPKHDYLLIAEELTLKASLDPKHADGTKYPNE